MTIQAKPHQETHVVSISDTAQAFGNEFPAAASTPYVLGLAEIAAHRSVSGSLAVTDTTVGVRSIIDHLAPSPVGAELLVVPELQEVDGRKLRFDIEVYDGAQLVARIEHHRVITNTDRINARLQKLGQSAEK